MAALKKAFEALGFKNVRTVLASGNVAFEAPRKKPASASTIARGLEEAFGFPVTVILRSASELRSIIDADPFRSLPPGPGLKGCVTFFPEKRPDRPRVRLPSSGRGFRILRVTPGEIFSVVNLSEDGRTLDLMAYVKTVFGDEGTTRTWGTILRLAATETWPRSHKGEDHGP